MKIKSLYVASLQKNAGSLIVSMGLMELLKKNFQKVAVFRPVVEYGEARDNDLSFLIDYFSLDMRYEDGLGFHTKELESLIAQNRTHDMLETLISKYNKLEQAYDFVLIEGLCRDSFSASIDFDLNLLIAKNLGSKLVSVLKGKNRSIEEILEDVRIEHEAIKNEGCAHFATFVNRIPSSSIADFKETLQSNVASDNIPVFVLPEIDELDKPTLEDIKSALDCELLLGEEKDLKRVMRGSKIAAMTTEHYIERLDEGDLVIVPGDRSDVIIASFASLYSRNCPNIAGLLLSGGLRPSSSVMRLLEGFGSFPLPVLSVETDTWNTAVNVEKTPALITAQSERKISLAMGLFNTYVDSNTIANMLEIDATTVITPAMFEFNLFERARSQRKTIVLPESSDERILRATEILLNRDVVEIVLLGNKEEILYKSSQLGLNIAKAQIVDPNDSPLYEEFVDTFYDLRKAKGLQLQVAKDTMLIPAYFGTMMVYKGMADGMVSGAINTTADTIRPALQIIKTVEGISIVSSVFFMCLDTKVLVYGDCAVNQNPNAEQLCEIAISSADTAMKFGIEPKIAMLSYSTGASGSGEDVEKVKKATKLVKSLRPDLEIEGPIQYDAAIDPDVAKTKLPNSKVAGQATIFIFPDLNTGNNTYKAVQRSANALAIGPVLQGLKKPVNDLSRGCLVADIVNTVAITAIQAQGGLQ